MKELKICIEAARKQRCDRAAQTRTQIPAQAVSLDPGRHERTAEAARAARLLVENLARRKSMRVVTAEPAVAAVRNGHELMTPAEVEARQRLLQEQADRLLHEAEKEASSK